MGRRQPLAIQYSRIGSDSMSDRSHQDSRKFLPGVGCDGWGGRSEQTRTLGTDAVPKTIVVTGSHAIAGELLGQVSMPGAVVSSTCRTLKFPLGAPILREAKLVLPILFCTPAGMKVDGEGRGVAGAQARRCRIKVGGDRSAGLVLVRCERGGYVKSAAATMNRCEREVGASRKAK